MSDTRFWIIGLILLTGIALLSAPQGLQAQAGSAGGTGLAFLKIGIGGQSVAMGEAAAALVQDGSAVYWNPAGLNFARNQAFFAHSEWLQGIRNEFLSVKISAVGAQIGLFWQLQSIDGIEQRDQPSEMPTSEVQAHDFAFGISIAQQITRSLWGGVTLKYIGERIWTYTTNGMAIDIGAIWKPAFLPTLSVALSLHNFGAMDPVLNEKVKLPALVRLAVAYRPAMFGDKADVALVAGTRKVFSGNTISGIGVESVFRGRFALRLGYRVGVEIGGISGGIGIISGGYQLDYAYSPAQLDFGNVHQISFSLNL
ncbi:MAG: PorV/PorQ family protein [candidate division KSB1 bacterium]|nr:PorV/PorQ family protein [candidate division KSB1 bacterium]MDQ7064125.1 PorV/PorQ family protein [candidate division KSB1 bacterium]